MKNCSLNDQIKCRTHKPHNILARCTADSNFKLDLALSDILELRDKFLNDIERMILTIEKTKESPSYKENSQEYDNYMESITKKNTMSWTIRL